ATVAAPRPRRARYGAAPRADARPDRPAPRPGCRRAAMPTGSPAAAAARAGRIPQARGVRTALEAAMTAPAADWSLMARYDRAIAVGATPPWRSNRSNRRGTP